MPLADQSDDGHAHIQRVASCAAAGIWERVQRDICPLITAHVLRLKRLANHAFKVDTCRLNALTSKIAAVIFLEDSSLKIQSRIGHGVQNFCPKPQNFVRHLAEVVKARESDVAVL